MRHRRDPAQQIAQTAPDQTIALGDSTVFEDRRLVGMKDICRPLCRIRVHAAPEARKQSEFEMIVSIDEARENQMPAQVEDVAFRGGG